MGTAGAGALAWGKDASSAIHNPAAMTRLDGHELMLGLAPGYGIVKFDKDSDSPVAGNNGGNQSGLVPLLSSAYVHKLSDRFRFGFGTFSMSGASLDPKNDWAGRNELLKIQLFTLTFMPTLAVRATDWLSLGAGPMITYANLEWKLDSPLGDDRKIKLDKFDDWGGAAFVGVLLEPSDDVRVGVVYQSETKLNLDGRTKLPIGVEANTKLELPLPQAVRLDVYWQVTEDLALLAGADWEDWSAAKTVPLSTSAGSAKVPLGFKDTFKVRGGVHYRVDPKWLLQAGASYDSSALNTSDRIAALPIDRQIRVGIGALHEWSESTRVGFGFEWLNLGDGNIDKPGPIGTGLIGSYKQNDIFFFVVNVNFSDLPWSHLGTF
jgi:long-chain fatty acid transport protein